MAHYAKIENGFVVQVNVIEEDFFNANPERYTGQWVQTSYNTYAGEHLLGGTPLRKNYAGIGYTYDEELDAFIPPKPFDSWLLDEKTCQWNAPKPYPSDDNIYNWNETKQKWEQVDA